MKIKEALNFINATTTVRAKVDDGVMYINEKLNSDDDWFMRISLCQSGWSAITADFDTCLDDDVDVMDLARVMDVIQRLLDTPVKKRSSEKKYRLRWIDDRNGKANYVYLDMDATWRMVTLKNFADIFTESGLEQLKKDNPHFAPAIDAMKEPAGDKND